MRKNVFAVTLCVVIVTGATAGCGQGKNTIDPPKNGWTIEQLMDVTYVCGQKFSYPLTFGSIEETFNISGDLDPKSDSRIFAELLCGDKYVGAVSYYSTGNFANWSKELAIDTFYCSNNESEKKDAIRVNGIKFGDNAADVEKAMGSPDEVVELTGSMKYHIGKSADSAVTFGFDDNKKLVSVDFRNIN